MMFGGQAMCSVPKAFGSFRRSRRKSKCEDFQIWASSLMAGFGDFCRSRKLCRM